MSDLLIKILIVAGGGVAVVIIVSGVGAALVSTGTPEACAERSIDSNLAAADELTAKWEEFKLRASTQVTSESFDEAGLTSRADQYMQDLGFGLDNLQVYVCPEGYAEATGGIEPPSRGFADPRLNHLATSPGTPLA